MLEQRRRHWRADRVETTGKQHRVGLKNTPGCGHRLASPLPVQYADESEHTPGRIKIQIDLLLEPLQQQLRPLFVETASAPVDRLDLARGRGSYRAIVAVADHEIVLHDAP